MARTKDLPASEPSSYTLLFKNGRATILLLVPPQTPFPTIMTDLLEVLQERYPNGLPASKPHDPAIPIPDSTEDLVFGIPLDPYEPSKGWQELDTAGVTATPKERELKDGSILAFAFVKEGEDVEFNVEWSSYDEAAVEGDDDDDEQ